MTASARRTPTLVRVGSPLFVPDYTRETFQPRDVARRPRRARRAVAALPRMGHRRRSRRHELRGRLRRRRPRARSGVEGRPRSPRRGRLPRAHVAAPARARGVRAGVDRGTADPDDDTSQTVFVAGRPGLACVRRGVRPHASRRRRARSARRVPPRCRRPARLAAVPELDDEPLAVEVAVEVEQERLDPSLRAAVVRVRADRDCGAVPERLPGVDPVRAGRRVARPLRCSPSGSRACHRASPATTMPSSSNGRPSILRGSRQVGIPRPRRGWRSTRRPRLLDVGTGEPGSESVSSAGPARAEPEVRSDRDRLRPDRGEVRRDELVGRKSHELGRERGDERVRDAGLGQELQPPLERGDEIDAVAEHDARMRVERDHGRLEPGVDRRPEHRAVSPVDAVERPDRDRSRPPLELGGA